VVGVELGFGSWGLGRPRHLTLTFNLTKAMVMSHKHAKSQGQRSVGSKDKVEKDR